MLSFNCIRNFSLLSFGEEAEEDEEEVTTVSKVIIFVEAMTELALDYYQGGYGWSLDKNQAI